jgi:hypothetical protein
MAEFVIPAANWADHLAAALRQANDGDTVVVRTGSMLSLAERAAERMGKTGVTLRVQESR